MSKRRGGCLHCCAGRTAPPSRLSCALPAGSRTRCGAFLPRARIAKAQSSSKVRAKVRKKLGLKLESEKVDGERVYRIVAGKAPADTADAPSA
jgi:hypothetical protein